MKKKTKSVSKDFIPVNAPLFAGNELKYVGDCIKSGWVSSDGPFIKRFEETFALRVKRAHGIAVTNGSAALEAAVVALGIGPGDEVILPAFTIISCAAAIVRAGAKPVLVDSDPVTWNMDVSQIAAKITSRTRAIMVVHTYGLPVDMEPVLALTKKHKLFIIEDAAEAHGLKYKGQPCGSFGDISIFSFYANKHVTCGEGGMILTNDAKIADKCRSLRNLCFMAQRRFVHEELGWNLRMTNLQAALGLAQLEQLDKFIEKKMALGAMYNRLLQNISCLQLPCPKTSSSRNIYWVFGIVLKDDCHFDAAEMMCKLSKMGIGARPFFYPMHLQPVFLKMGYFKGEHYPVAELLAQRGFYLPSGLGLSALQIHRVVKAMHAVMCA